MPWTPLPLRPAELRQALEQALEKAGVATPVEEYYNAQELGLLSDGQLEERITQLQTPAVAAREVPAEPVPEPDSPALRRTFKEGQAFEVRSLRYLKSQADSAEDRRWAERLHDSMLVELWLQHVVETGETYYPPLAEDLLQAYQLHEDEHHR